MKVYVNCEDRLSDDEFKWIKGKLDIVYYPSNKLKIGTIRNDKKELVGMFAMSHNYDFINIDSLEIFDEYRGLGYGKSFFKKMKDIYPNIRSFQGVAIDGSLGFYESLDGDGFKMTLFGLCDFCDISDCDHYEEGGGLDCPVSGNIGFNLEAI